MNIRIGSKEISTAKLYIMPRNHVILNNYQEVELLSKKGWKIQPHEVSGLGRRKVSITKNSNHMNNFKNNSKQIKKTENELDNNKFKAKIGTSAKFSEAKKLLVQWLWEMFDEIHVQLMN